MIVHTADGENQFIDYREVASSGQTAESWLDDSGNLIENANSVGGLAVGVPGEVAGLELALSQFGSGKLSRQQIMQPAIHPQASDIRPQHSSVAAYVIDIKDTVRTIMGWSPFVTVHALRRIHQQYRHLDIRFTVTQ